MRISDRYRRSLERYLEWEKVRTPFSGLQFADAAVSLPHVNQGGSTTAAEWLCEFESRGNALPDCCEIELLERYWRGKAMRDWWSKESAWWRRHSAAIAEEWLGFLGPLPFIELFGRAPITPLVRYFHDNRYSNLQFRLDTKISEWTRPEGRFPYFQRDDRDSCWKVLWRLFRIAKLDPWVWKLKRKLTLA